MPAVDDVPADWGKPHDAQGVVWRELVHARR
jgi:hypothetical protein